MGATLRVPGVSGGAVAVILGCYNKLLYCLNNIFREFKACFSFLAVFAVGAGVAFLALNEVLYTVMGKYPAIAAYCFIGMLMASFPIVFKESGVKKADFVGEKRAKLGEKTPKMGAKWGVFGGYCALFLLGAGLVAGLGFLQGGLDVDGLRGVGYYSFIVMCGVVCGFVFIIPGVSFATMLLVFGIDPLFTKSLHNFDFLFLVPFGIGGMIGFLLCAKIMYVLFKRFSKQTYMVIMGFLLGSIVLLFALPEYRPLDATQGWICAVSFVIGATIVLGVFYIALWLEKRRQRKIDCALIKETL